MPRHQKILLCIAALSASVSGLLVHHLLSVSKAPASVTPAALQTRDGGSLAAQIAPTMRAAAISLKDDAGLGPLVAANDWVDVILTRETSPGKRTESETILRGARVLSGSQKADAKPMAGAARAQSVTLEVTPVEAEILASARSGGKLSLVLAAASDSRDPAEVTRTTPRAAPASGVRIIKFGVETSASRD